MRLNKPAAIASGTVAVLVLVIFVSILRDPLSGEASYYSDKLHGRPTASGEPYDKNKLTAAHPELPFGTQLKVTYLKTGKSVVVTVNDRGPRTGGRVIDLSRAAAERIGLFDDGVGEVKVEVLRKGGN